MAATTETPAGTPTYFRDVAPLLTKHCAGCHSPGGIAPFTLRSYEEVSAVGQAVAASTAARKMPPFPADNSGACATYLDAAWLTEEEISTLGRWVKGGMPKGSPKDLVAVETEKVSLDDANHTLQMPVDYTPNAEISDDYRCLLFEHDFEGSDPAYVTAYQVIPGEPRVVHHVLVYQATDDAGAKLARELDDKDPGPGYTCFGAVGVPNAQMLMTWSPGGGVSRHPEGTGIPVDPKRPFIVQIHYNLANGALPDRTRVRLKTSPSVQHPMRPWFFTDAQLNLPPGQASVEKIVDLPVSVFRQLRPGSFQGPMTIMGVRAHMHTTGIKQRLERIDEAGQVSCLINIDDYDFGWQRGYFLAKPVPLNPGDRLRMRCEYDTRSRDKVTTWGEGTSDEMCLGALYTIEGAP